MNTRTMAASLDGYGDLAGLRVGPLPRRPPRTGEIEVSIAAASVNPIDVRRCGGYGRRLFGLIGAARMPLVLGNDFAGTICAVGHGVTGLREGDAVFGAKPPSRDGTHAARVTLVAAHAARQPAAGRPVPGLCTSALASLPYNYLTVSRALAGAGITAAAVRGRPVLVHGASGRLGLLAIWLLKTHGAQVTAVAGTDLQACLAAGADVAVNRHQTSLHSLPRCYAATLNFAAWEDEPALLRLLAPDALGHASTVHPLLAQLDRHGLLLGAVAALGLKRRMHALLPSGARYDWTVFRPDRAALAALADHAEHASLARALQPTVRYALADAIDAYRHVATQRPGRAVLTPAT